MITTGKISHFLLQLHIIKSYNFHPTSALNYEFHTLSQSSIFLTAHRSKECLSIPVGMQENLQPILFVPLINIRNKKIKSWTQEGRIIWKRGGIYILCKLWLCLFGVIIFCLMWEFITSCKSFLLIVRSSYSLWEFLTRCENFLPVVRISYLLREFPISCENVLLVVRISHLLQEFFTPCENLLPIEKISYLLWEFLTLCETFFTKAILCSMYPMPRPRCPKITKRRKSIV